MSRPEQGTPEYDLWVAAIEVAISVPMKQGTHVYAAGVPWSLIHDLRAKLAAVGIDWQATKQRQDQINRERRARALAEHEAQR